MTNRFSEGGEVDSVLRHDVSKIRLVVNGVIGRDVKMRQFAKGRVIVQDVGDKGRFRVGVVTSESQHSKVSSKGIPEKNMYNY